MNKNILYLLPYDFFYDDAEMAEKQLDLLAEELTIDLKSFIEYRIIHTNCDTYVCFFSRGNIIFLKYENNKFIFYDIVSTNKSKKFAELEDINEIWRQE